MYQINVIILVNKVSKHYMEGIYIEKDKDVKESNIKQQTWDYINTNLSRKNPGKTFDLLKISIRKLPEDFMVLGNDTTNPRSH